MKKVLNVFLEHAILILSLVAVFFCDVTFLLSYLVGELFVAFIAAPFILVSLAVSVFVIVYAVLFFRKENFLTPLLTLILICLGKMEISVIAGMFWAWCVDTVVALITLIICLCVRLVAVVLIRKYKEKLQTWTGEEKITSDAVFWVKVLFRHN